MKIIDKSLTLAYSLFPKAYAERRGERYQAFHFAFAYERNRLLAIGQNSYSFNSKALIFAKRYHIPETIKFPSLHAEIDCISKLWGRVYIDSSIKLVVIRLNKKGELHDSKPCKNCSVVLDALGLNKVWYSTKRGVVSE